MYSNFLSYQMHFDVSEFRSLPISTYLFELNKYFENTFFDNENKFNQKTKNRMKQIWRYILTAYELLHLNIQSVFEWNVLKVLCSIFELLDPAKVATATLC